MQSIKFLIYDTSAKEENIEKEFYGPPTNCTELGQLGYTLNGYYLVNRSHTSKHIEIVLCRFEILPSNYDSTF